jgi:arylsulfatase A-like enzyme
VPLALAGAFGCGSEGPPNVLLVTIDTMRADRAGCYGYPGKTTPSLDALAASGVVFEQARVHAPITGPSHASLLTGTVPAFHGVVGNLQHLPSTGVSTLAECFQSAGYRTGASVGAFVVASKWGFGRGFDAFREELPIAPSGAAILPERLGAAVVADALSWVKERPNDPFFLWVHLFDPHSPYAAPAPFGGSFRDPYDAEIAYSDHCVGMLIDELRALRLLDNTLIVVTSDHGESLGEHAEDTHAFFLYNSTLAVPLVFSSPNLLPTPRRVPSLARSIDVMPTILEIVGLPIPPAVQGRSLAALARGDAGTATEPRASVAMTDELHLAFGWSPLRSIEQDGWKYIRSPKPELYELSSDPHETHNRAAERSEIVRSLDERLLEDLASTRGNLPRQTSTVDAATLERLMSLGYIAGGSHAAPADASADLSRYADPKDRLSYWEHYRKLSGLRADGDLEAAEALGRTLLADDPSPPLINYLFGQILWRKSQRTNDPATIREAALHLERASVMDEYRNSCLVFIGIAHARLGEDDEARRSFEEILKRTPDEPMANFNLTLLHAKRQDWPAVIRHGETLLRRLPAHPEAGAIRSLVERAKARTGSG